MRSIYCVQIFVDDESIALFEDPSFNRTIKFLDTIDLDRVGVRFFRHHPYKEYNPVDILEVYRNEI